MTLLHIDSSIQGDASASRVLSAAIVERLRSLDPALAVTYRDLARDGIAHLTLDQVGDAEGERTLAEFLAADTVVIGAALYNFTIASQLKAWIDRILIPGRTFQYGEGWPEGLVGDKRVIIALARGGVYSDGPFASFEHAEPLLRSALAFIGITSPQFIIAEGLALGDDARQSALDAALDQVARLPLAA